MDIRPAISLIGSSRGSAPIDFDGLVGQRGYAGLNQRISERSIGSEVKVGKQDAWRPGAMYTPKALVPSP
jgi:hypothetical protein